MKHIYLYISMAILLMVPCTGFALQDSYIGDTAIYGGATSAPNPNVLIVFDSSGSMGNTCSGCTETKITIAKSVISNLIGTTTGVNFGVMRLNDTEGGIFIKSTVDGTEYTTTIKDMDEIHTTVATVDTTNRQALIEIVNNINATGYTPLAETLFEAMRYFTGGESVFDDTTNFPNGYTSPIMASCQSSYVIVITDGISRMDQDPILTSICDAGDCDNDAESAVGTHADGSDYLDDVAWYLNKTDLSDAHEGPQNVKTYTIAFDLSNTTDPEVATAVNLLEDTADNGQGKLFAADNAEELSAALTSILIAVQEKNTAFVAPVVPTSPENKVYSGERIYLGFFKPKTNGTWIGNLKKYGLSDNGEVLDKNGNIATDDDGTFLDTSTPNSDADYTAVSYWSSSADGGNVEAGGVGAALLNMSDVFARKIYTFTEESTTFIELQNLLIPSDQTLTSTPFDVTTTEEHNQVINYIYGLDAYDEDIDTIKDEKRAWIMGDILHSKPVIQTYNNFLMEDEDDVTANKTVIFVGSNDGQLHAFNDADGSELWSFIPPQALPYLNNLNNDEVHEYFMDGSPIMYVYDYDQDGNIGTGPETDDTDPSGMQNNGADDKAIMIVSMRRGGGIDTLHATESRGYYFALDVTNPAVPVFLWTLDSSTLGELGETWSDPVIGKIRLNNEDKIVAFIGAGYDNNEDLRFGDTQGFPDTTDATTLTTAATSDAGAVTSAGNDTQFEPRGRGIYVIQIATLDSDGISRILLDEDGNPTTKNLWEYVYDPVRATNNPTFSFPTEIAPLDYDFDGYIDRLYAGDTGGNMWRFDISAKDVTTTWSGTKVFSANPSDTNISGENPATNGRKIFHRPSIVQEPGYVGVYFGTGDRAHPLNKAVVDRLYAFYDRNVVTTPKTEFDLVNVTEDILQDADAGIDDINDKLNALYAVDGTGWFIKLNLDDGEKVLANPLVFNKVAYFTTFRPIYAEDDPCAAGNLGEGRIYAVNYKTGEAVFNFDLTNDVTNNNVYDAGENARAKGRGDGEILRRSDRFKVLGPGIPSGVVVVVRSDGTSSALVGCGGGLCGGETKDGGTIIPLYWIME